MAKKGGTSGSAPGKPQKRPTFTWSPSLPPELTIGKSDDKANETKNDKAKMTSPAKLLKRYNALLAKAKVAVNAKTTAAERKTIATARKDLAAMRIRLDKLGFGNAKVTGKGASKTVIGQGIKKALKKAK